jgi:hypothetical protein
MKTFESDFMNYQLPPDTKDKTYESDFMNYQLPADAKDKCCSEDSELLLPKTQNYRRLRIIAALLFRSHAEH